MRSPAAVCSVLSMFVLLGEALCAQGGQWTLAFNHLPNSSTLPGAVDPASDSIAFSSLWVTQHVPPVPAPPHLRMNVVHACLIPSGLHRGEVLVWDGNLTNIGVRTGSFSGGPVVPYQPWSIVNPYWPQPNPNFWPGMPPVSQQHRFHNSLLQMPVGEGDLFCAGHCWMADGRLAVAGGTKQYPIQTGYPGIWQGGRLFYQWDHVPTAGSPFGTWHRMANIEAHRWYPTLVPDGTANGLQEGVLILGGTNFKPAPTNPPGYLMDFVNSYEVGRIVFNAQPSPQLQPAPQDFDRKSVGPTQPTWLSPPFTFTIPPPSDRQYWGPAIPLHSVPAPLNQHPILGLGNYPRAHVLGFLDTHSSGIGRRIFVSGFNAWGFRLVHDLARDPVFGTTITGPGFEIGQFPANNDAYVSYAPSLLWPGPIGGPSTQVVRFGGARQTPPGAAAPTNLVETVDVSTLQPPASWQSGTGAIPPMNHVRYEANAVFLPNGDVFVVGGVSSTGPPAIPVLTPELLAGGTVWRDAAPHTSPRGYHSTAILLPDARVFVCGGEGCSVDYEIWEPPYFTLSYGSVPPTDITVRHKATAVTVPQDLVYPNGMLYAQTYEALWTNTLEPGIEVNSVVLMRPAALTHHDDGGQRLVRLNAWHDEVDGGISFKSPSSDLIAPRGWWMLFLVTTSGRPSLAYWVNLG